MANFYNILPSWTGRITSGFGPRGTVADVSKASKMHKGVDLSASAESQLKGSASEVSPQNPVAFQ